MVLPKPTSNSNWGEGNPDFANRVVEPSVGKKQAAWLDDERPPAPIANWLWYIHDQWIKYLESKTDAQFVAFDVVIGDTATNSAATHDTLQDAVDDGSLGSNVAVIILENQTINTTIDLSKSFWRIYCMPGVTFTKGAAATAVSVNAEGIEWLNGRFVGYTSGGDKVFNCTALGIYGKIIGARFAASTTAAITDSLVAAGKKPVSSQNISEV